MNKILTVKDLSIYQTSELLNKQQDIINELKKCEYGSEAYNVCLQTMFNCSRLLEHRLSIKLHNDCINL